MDLEKMTKADDSDELDLSAAFDFLVEVTPGITEPVGVDASVETVKQLGLFDRSGLVNQVSERAVSQASRRAADMVTQISETTRDDINRIITEGLANNIGKDEIQDQLEEAYAFSPDRAYMIANTEIAMANSQAVLETYHEARDAGVRVMKEWQADDDACEECLANEAAGAIELEDDFPSGDDAPPGHPNCECVLLPVVIETESEADTDAERGDDDAG